MSTEKRAVIRLFLAICCVISCNGLTDLPKPLAGTNTYQLRMPGVTPQKVSTHLTWFLIQFIDSLRFYFDCLECQQDDDYVCTAYKLEPDQQLYITRFRVEGTAERAHHMILSGCGNIPSAAVENSSWYFVARISVDLILLKCDPIIIQELWSSRNLFWRFDHFVRLGQKRSWYSIATFGRFPYWWRWKLQDQVPGRTGALCSPIATRRAWLHGTGSGDHQSTVFILT